jgi:hypothetical protein
MNGVNLVLSLKANDSVNGFGIFVTGTDRQTQLIGFWRRKELIEVIAKLQSLADGKEQTVSLPNTFTTEQIAKLKIFNDIIT